MSTGGFADAILRASDSKSGVAATLMLFDPVATIHCTMLAVPALYRA